MRHIAIRTVLIAIAFVGLAPTGSTYAITVNYTVDGWGPMQFRGPYYEYQPDPDPTHPQGWPGDTVELQEYTGTLDLSVGSSIQKINTLLWTVNYTWAENPETHAWEVLNFDIFAPRSMSFEGMPGSNLFQDGLLEVTWDNDYLTFYEGSTTGFVVGGYVVRVTPLALERRGAVFGEKNLPPWIQPEQDVMARFDISEVPEPTAVFTGALLLAVFGAGKFMSARRKRA